MKQKKKRVQWEYLVVVESFAVDLNYCGKQGWELVSVILKNIKDCPFNELYFKRPLVRRKK